LTAHRLSAGDSGAGSGEGGNKRREWVEGEGLGEPWRMLRRGTAGMRPC
jgi:hypothetical protein